MASVLSGPPCPLPGGRGRQGEGFDYWQRSIAYVVFRSLLRSSIPGMYLMVLQAARAAPRIAYCSLSLISSSVAPACLAAEKRPGTQDVQPAAAMAASCMAFGSSAPSRQ